MFEKLFIKAVDVIALTSMTGMCLSSNNPIPTTEYQNEPIEIIETMPVTPDPVKLLENEIKSTKHWDEGCKDDTVQLTQEEAYLLMQIASTEALNQGVDGMLMIMQTIINRVNNPSFPNTLIGVVSQPGQFTSYTSGLYKKAKITPDVRMALVKLEQKTDWDKNLIAFERTDNGSVLLRWFDYYKQYKDHVFYKQKGKK